MKKNVKKTKKEIRLEKAKQFAEEIIAKYGNTLKKLAYE